MEKVKEKNEEVKNCSCTDGGECTCGDECQCGDECACGDDCTCGDTCISDEDIVCKDGVCEVKPKKEKKGFFKKDDKVKKLEEKVSSCEATIKELENKILVASADNINYRKRKDEEVSRILKFCNQDIIKDLLPVADNFERALKLAEDKTDPEFVKFTEGYKMVYCSIQNILEKYDVKAIDGNNKAFDPVYHNAVITEEKEGVEPGVVLEVLQKGYLYKDKVIRPAMVKVSS